MLLRLVALCLCLWGACPARADIVLSYHLSSWNGPGNVPIPNNLPLGPMISDLTLSIGETRYIQIAITANANAPMIVQGQNQANWTGQNSLITFGLQFNYPVNLINQPYVQPWVPLLDQNKPNANSQAPYAVSHPVTYPNYNMGSTIIGGLTFGGGYQANAGILPTSVVATLKVVAIASGTSPFSITDPNSPLSASSFGLDDATNLDPFIFAPTHNNYSFSMHVNSVPEPASMGLAGLAMIIGLYRRR